jgi:hypothetical protein
MQLHRGTHIHSSDRRGGAHRRRRHAPIPGERRKNPGCTTISDPESGDQRNVHQHSPLVHESDRAGTSAARITRAASLPRSFRCGTVPLFLGSRFALRGMIKV